MTTDVQAATKEFAKLLENGYYSVDRSTNTAEDYSGDKEKRDTEASIRYANSNEFRKLCAEKGLING